MIELVPTAIILASLALLFSLVSTALWVAQRLSTHKIEWRTLKLDDAQDVETLSKKLNEPFDDQEYDAL